MGVRMTFGYGNERVFSHARDWYVTDERVLQIYQQHDGDPQFVIAEYNRDAWDSVEWDPPLPPEPQKESPIKPGKWYREHTAEQLRAEHAHRGLDLPQEGSDDVEQLARSLRANDEKEGML